MAATTSAGVPVEILHEGEGHVVTIELKSGQSYRGKLVDSQDDMNCLLQGVTCTTRDGKVTKKESVFIRGSHIKYFVLPDILRNAPVLKKVASAALDARAAAKGKSRPRKKK